MEKERSEEKVPTKWLGKNERYEKRKETEEWKGKKEMKRKEKKVNEG